MQDQELRTGLAGALGRAVVTADGSTVGTVKEAYGRYFKIDAPMQRDYWLAGDAVQSIDDSTVLLACAEESVDQRKLKKPEFDPAEDPMAAITGGPVISAEEMLEQRARMERELAEQSRHLPPHEPSVTQVRGARAYEVIPSDHNGFGSLAGTYVPNAPVQDRIEADVRAARRRRQAVKYGLPIVAGMASLTIAGLAFRSYRAHQQPRSRVAQMTEGAEERLREVAHRAAAATPATSMLVQRVGELISRIGARFARARS